MSGFLGWRSWAGGMAGEGLLEDEAVYRLELYVIAEMAQVW
jgi:hypothetical protein